MFTLTVSRKRKKEREDTLSTEIKTEKAQYQYLFSTSFPRVVMKLPLNMFVNASLFLPVQLLHPTSFDNFSRYIIAVFERRLRSQKQLQWLEFCSYRWSVKWNCIPSCINTTLDTKKPAWEASWKHFCNRNTFKKYFIFCHTNLNKNRRKRKYTELTFVISIDRLTAFFVLPFRDGLVIHYFCSKTPKNSILW